MVAIGTLAVWSYVNSSKDAKVLAQISATPDSSQLEMNTPERAKAILGYYWSKYVYKGAGGYGEMYAVLQCESGFLHDNIYGDGGRAYGIAQFHKPTWERFNKMRGTNLDYKNMDDQINMFVWAFNNNLKEHWSCFNNLK